MATKYGYVSRDTANRQIDWGAIGTQVSDGITKITEDRKERREDILTKSTDYAKMLIDMPMGSNTAFNEYLAQFTTQASKAALADLNLLKTGNISEQEYYNRRANLLSGTELMIAGANNFNKNYDLIQERIDNGTASAVEIKYREKMAQLLEFGNRTPFINPDTREVNTARLAPSGIMETTVEDIASASDMFRISNFQLNKFDMNSAIEDITKNIGIQDVTITPEMVRKAQSEGRSIGAVGTRVKGAFNSALMSEKETELAKKDYVSSYLKDDSAVISILADYVPGYDVTLDPFEVDEKTVLIGRNGAYEITDEQRKAAEEYMIDRLDKALPETETPVAGLTAAQKATNELRQQEIDIRKETLDFQKGQSEKKGVVSYTASDNLMVDPEDPVRDGKPNFINPRKYLQKFKPESFTGNKIEDTVNGIQAVLNHQGFTEAQINTAIIEPQKEGGTLAGKILRFAKAGAGIAGRPLLPEQKIKDANYAIEIKIPGLLSKPIILPTKNNPQLELDKIIELLDFAKENNIQITPNQIREQLTAANKRLFDEYQNLPVTGGTSSLKRALPKPKTNNE